MNFEDSFNETGCQAPKNHRLCANGCGFFGTPATLNLCSKCYRDFVIKEEQAASTKAVVEKSLSPTTSTQQQLSISSPISVDSSSLAPLEPSSSESSSAINYTATSVVGNTASVETGVKNRCGSCSKRVGMLGFKCRCGTTFCSEHRYPEMHACMLDFKGMGWDAIAKANPIVKADKVRRI